MEKISEIEQKIAAEAKYLRDNAKVGRGQTEPYRLLFKEYLTAMAAETSLVMESLVGFEICQDQYALLLKQFGQFVVTDENKAASFYKPYLDILWELVEANRSYEQNRTLLLQEIVKWLTDYELLSAEIRGAKEACRAFAPLADLLQAVSMQIEQIVRLAVRATEMAQTDLDAKQHVTWDEQIMNKRRVELEELQYQMTKQLRLTRYYYTQLNA